jgi:hypothetical protein
MLITERRRKISLFIYHYIIICWFIDIAPVLDNYLNFGGDVFGHTEAYQTIMFDFIKTVLISTEANEESRGDAIQLIEPFLLRYRGRMDSYVPEFLNLAVHVLQSAEGHKLRLVAIEVTLVCIYYHSQLTMDYIETHGLTEALFEFWFSHLSYFKRVHDKKLCLLAIFTLFEHPVSQWPIPIQNRAKSMIETIARMFDELPEAYKKRQEEEKLIEDGGLEEKESGVSNGHEDMGSDVGSSDRDYEDFEDADLDAGHSDDFDWNEDDKDFVASDSDIVEEFGYETPVDYINEYQLFETRFFQLPSENPELYRMMNELDEKQQQSLHRALQKAKHPHDVLHSHRKP